MNMRKIKALLFTLLAIAALVVCTLCGCSDSGSSQSINWVIKTIRNNYYKDIPESELYQGILKNGVISVLDIYSDYYTKEEYEQLEASNSGSKSGIGITYMNLERGVTERGSGIYVTSVVGGSPAYKSGLKAGTFITGASFDGQSVSFSSSSDLVDTLSGRATGEEFTLITDRGDYVVSKQNYVGSYCIMHTSQKTFSFSYDTGNAKMDITEEGIEYLPEGAAYIRLDQFYGNAVNEFASLMAKYNSENCTSLILDLRQNGGGYVNVMCGISGIFTGQLNLSSSNAMSAVYKNNKRENYQITRIADKNCHFPAGGKISILADNGTASASEALIGVLISYGVAQPSDVYISDFDKPYLTYTGTESKNCKTYGKGIMQTTFVNESTKEALKLTTAKIYWPDGTCIHDVGLSEDMGCKTVKTDICMTYGDEQLQRAIGLIYN